MQSITLVCIRVLTMILVPICIYIAVLFALVRSGEQVTVSTNDNFFLELADDISPDEVPSVNVALARYNQLRASLSEVDTDSRQKWLDESLGYWLKAHQARPNWPYYLLGALGVELMLGNPDHSVGELFDQVIALAPNERGIDQPLLEVSMMGWQQLNKNQQGWVVNRLETVMPSTLSLTLKTAEKYHIKGIVCSRLTWQIAKKHCLR